jgi:two-component system, NarL family, response regulator NreC
MDTIRMLIADDHAVLRSGLRMLLDAQQDIEVVAEADSGTQVLALAEELQPDLILLDVSMPNLGGLEVLPLLRKTVPQSRVLILTMHDDESYLRQALRDGSSGYVLKRAADTELLSAIRAVMRGEVYVHPSLTRTLLNDILPVADANVSNLWEALSKRECDVLLRVARGFTSAKIAEQLNLSPKTVDTYRARGMEKLGLRSRAALVQYVLSHGLLSKDLNAG